MIKKIKIFEPLPYNCTVSNSLDRGKTEASMGWPWSLFTTKIYETGLTHIKELLSAERGMWLTAAVSVSKSLVLWLEEED